MFIHVANMTVVTSSVLQEIFTPSALSETSHFLPESDLAPILDQELVPIIATISSRWLQIG
jgi:hypothetical protein